MSLLQMKSHIFLTQNIGEPILLCGKLADDNYLPSLMISIIFAD